jgi:transposase
MGPLQTIPRGGKAWGAKPLLRPDRYKRNGTLYWFSAFCPSTGKAIGKGFPNRATSSCEQFFLKQLIRRWPHGTIHLIMDNLNTHGKALKSLPAKDRRRIRPYYTPFNSSWLNLVESYFATLQRTALHNTDYKTTAQINSGLQNGMRYLNKNPKAYKWKKV